MQIESCSKESSHGRGFTLLELMVTVSIVAALAAITSTAVPGIRERSHRAVCAGNIRQQVGAMIALASDNNNQFYWPASSSGDDSCPEHLYPDYIESLDVFVCPSTHNHVRDRVHPLTKKNPDLQNNATNAGDYYGHSYEYFGMNSKGVKGPLQHNARPERTVLVLDGDDYGVNNFPDKENNHGEDGWNWGFADGHVEWVSREDTNEKLRMSTFYK